MNALHVPAYAGHAPAFGYAPGGRILVPVHCYACERGMAVGDIWGDVGDFFSDAAACCGRLLEAGGRLIAEIPIIGDIFSAAFKIFVAPLEMIKAIARGDNIGDAIVSMAKSAIAAVHDLAPYIQAVLSVVPGIGTGLSAVISGGLALASGMPIDQVLIEAVKGAIPGGPLAQAAFVVASSTITAAAHGQNIGKALESAAVQGGLQLIKFTPGIVETLSTAGKALSDGATNAAMQALDTVTKAVPPEAMKGLELAISFGAGASIQSKTLDQVKTFGGDQFDTLTATGFQNVQSNDVLSAAMGTTAGSRADEVVKGLLSVRQKTFAFNEQHKGLGFSMPDLISQLPADIRPTAIKATGYLQGLGLQAHFEVNESIIQTVRGKLDPGLAREGFDFATATRIGAVKAAPMSTAAAASIAAKADPRANVFVSQQTAVRLSQAAAAAAQVKAGYYTAIGLKSAATYQKQAMMPALLSAASMKAGALTAATIVDQQLAGNPWDVLMHVRAIVQKLAAGDAGTVASVAAVRAQAGKGDARAKKLLLMIDIVNRLNAEERAATDAIKSHKLDGFEHFWSKLLDIPRSLTRGL